MKKLWLAGLLSLMSLAVWAGEAKDVAEDPVVEKRMVKLAETLRCPMCQNESLASSHAEVAIELRQEMREMMKKGMSDQEVTDYMVARYGDFVRYDPPMKSTTALLWFGPFALLLTGAGVLFYQLRKRYKAIPEPELTADAQQRAAALLNDQEDKRA